MEAELAGNFLKRTAPPAKQVDQLLVYLRNEIIAAKALHEPDVLLEVASQVRIGCLHLLGKP